MQRLILILLSVIFMSGCSAAPQKSTTETYTPIVGIWAMVPLRNGIANVAELTADGRSTLYPFNCNQTSPYEVELSNYTISDDRKHLYLDLGHDQVEDLTIISIGEHSMSLSQQIGDIALKFDYIKVNEVTPLCSLYPSYKKEKKS